MTHDIKLYLIAIGLPALVLALGGLRLLQSEGLRLRENDRLDLEAEAKVVASTLNNSIAKYISQSITELGGDSSVPTYPLYLTKHSPLLRGARWANAFSSELYLYSTPEGYRKEVALDIEPLALLSRMPEFLRQCGADDASDLSPRATIAEVRSADGKLLMPASIAPTGSIYGEARLSAPLPSWYIRLYRRGGDSALAADLGRFTFIGIALMFLLISTLIGGGALLVRDARRARMEARSQVDFVAAVSHELKTPLTTICLCSELAASESITDNQRKRALASISSEAERLKRMVLAVLDFGKLEGGRRNFVIEEICLSKVLNEVIELMKGEFANGGLILSAKDDILVKADSDAISEILCNLLENGKKYASSYGAIEVSAFKSNGKAIIEVADHGPGVDDYGLKHIFDKFWRAESKLTRESNGYGLGLTISRGLARGMGGDIVVQPRDGGGLIFRVTLPLGGCHG